MKKKKQLLLSFGEKMRSWVEYSQTYSVVTCGGAVQVQAELSSAAQEEIDLMSAVITGAAAGRRVNRPQLDQLERLTISFIRSHVGSMGLLPISFKFWPLTLLWYPKEPLTTGFLFEDDLIHHHHHTGSAGALLAACRLSHGHNGKVLWHQKHWGWGWYPFC